MKNHPKYTSESRRHFLNIGFLLGISLCFNGKRRASRGSNILPPKKVRLINADGQVVEVDQHHLPPSTTKQPISNEELELWKKGRK